MNDQMHTNSLNWKSIVEEQERSGKTQVEFCKEKNISAVRLGYYRKKFGLIRSTKKIKAPKQSKNIFSPIHIKKPEPNTDISITLPNGFQCAISSIIEANRIKEIVEVLLTC